MACPECPLVIEPGIHESVPSDGATTRDHSSAGITARYRSAAPPPSLTMEPVS